MEDADMDVDVEMDEADAEVLEGLGDDEDCTKSPAESDAEGDEAEGEAEGEVEAEAEVEGEAGGEPEVAEAPVERRPHDKQRGRGETGEGASRVTEPRLTKFECVRILGARATQLAQGAPPNIAAPPSATPLQVATMELEQGKTPFLVQRPLPCGAHETWRVAELVRSPADLHPIVRTTTAYYGE